MPLICPITQTIRWFSIGFMAILLLGESFYRYSFCDMFNPEILTGSPSAGHQAGWGGKNKLFSRFVRRYLERVRDTIKVTTRKLHMHFRLTPRLMTLDDLEQL